MAGEVVATLPQTSARAGARSETIVAAAFAVALGLFLLWGVGFAAVPALHNAAHDTRHSMSFPCH